ncbi:hypothetical protein NDU88_001362 [Pleurodeles waltl]|uniref:Uncharacterized protein n=1 Tax=Pleurodeles waltl TaxID=8319 RepID=A0AAV7LFR8_PLEWA|nr:hypothetical protein NDU88_001362 [Pleurodeles waltl]
MPEATQPKATASQAVNPSYQKRASILGARQAHASAWAHDPTQPLTGPLLDTGWHVRLAHCWPPPRARARRHQKQPDRQCPAPPAAEGGPSPSDRRSTRCSRRPNMAANPIGAAAQHSSGKPQGQPPDQDVNCGGRKD